MTAIIAKLAITLWLLFLGFMIPIMFMGTPSHKVPVPVKATVVLLLILAFLTSGVAILLTVWSV